MHFVTDSMVGTDISTVLREHPFNSSNDNLPFEKYGKDLNQVILFSQTLHLQESMHSKQNIPVLNRLIAYLNNCSLYSKAYLREKVGMTD